MSDRPELQAHLEFVRSESPYFREAWREVPARFSLADLPVTDHTGYWQANDTVDNRLLTAPHDEGLVFKSGGTTGNPKFSFFSREDWRHFCSVFGRGMLRAGMQPGEKIANVFYGGQLYASLMFISRSIEEAGAGICYPIAGNAPAEEIIEALQQFRIDTIAGVPTTLMAMLPQLAEADPESLNVRRFIYGGEAMYPDQIEAVKRVLPNCKVSSIGIAGVDYGEMGWVDESCAPGVHRCFDESTVLELLDDEGKPIDEPGTEGNLHITNFRRRLMPIVRYPVGDRAVWIDPPGESGRRFRVLGRTEVGARVGPITLYFEDMQRILQQQVGDVGVAAFQMVIEHCEARDRCTLRVGVNQPDSIPPALTAKVTETLYEERHLFPQLIAERLVHPLRIEWVSPDALHTNPRTGKLMRVIDRRQDG